MKRFPMVLAVMAGVPTVLSGSALAAAVRHAASPPVNSAVPTIAGTAREAQTLTASNGTWGGVTPITYTYRWQRCNSSGSSCSSIGGATNQNYVVSHSDVNRTIRVDVTATNVDGTSQALSAATVQVVAIGSAPVNTKQPSAPTGTPQDGLTLTVDNGNWSGSQPIAFSYQWQSCTAVNPVCADIAGATSSTFLIGTSQVGSLLRTTVTATNSSGKTSAFSNLTAALIAKTGMPVNTRVPAISGTLAVGQRLQSTTGTWTGVVGNSFAYQWARCNSNGAACASISGATGQSYGIGQADLGMALRVNVKATNSAGSTTATSAASRIGAPAVVTTRFTAVLRTNQEVRRPKGTTSRTAGSFSARLTGSRLTWTLSFAHVTARPTATRLNKGARGTNGIAFKTLCVRCLSPTHGTVTLTASQRDALRRGLAYVNILTTRNPYGELRGQIVRLN